MLIQVALTIIGRIVQRQREVSAKQILLAVESIYLDLEGRPCPPSLDTFIAFDKLSTTCNPLNDGDPPIEQHLSSSQGPIAVDSRQPIMSAERSCRTY